MTDNSSWGAKWIAAVIAPWTISPHPNFSQKTIDQASALALVSEARYWREQERFEVEADSASSDQQYKVPLAAAASLNSSTQAEGTEELWQLAYLPDLIPGARVAAALYAAIGSSELEGASDAADRLETLRVDLTSGLREPNVFTPSQRLIVAALEQQRVLRLFDSRRFEEARQAVEGVLRWVPVGDQGRLDDFEVSQGISWKAQRVQRDIATSIRAHATRARVSLEFPEARSWVSVVKSRAGWVDMRESKLAADRDATVLRDAFEAKFESTSGTQHFMRQTAAEAGYAALLVSELSGSPGGARADREQLGKIVMLERGATPEGAREGIRLLRQADATGPLKSILNWLRSQGPTQPIVSEAIAIMTRATRDRWVSESDLQVLATAADFLSKSQRREAIQVCLFSFSTEQLGRSVSWSLHDKVWTTIGYLLPESGADKIVLKAMDQYLDEPGYLSEPFTSTLAQAVEAMSWPATTVRDRSRWESWAAKTEDSPDVRRLRVAIQSKSETDVVLLPGAPTIERAAFLADHGLPDGVDPSELERMSDYLVARLTDEAHTARAGQYSFGGYVTSNVAVAFAMRFNDKNVWHALTPLLIDRDVDAVLKEDALDRMARFADRIPTDVAQVLKANIDAVLKGKRGDHFFASNSLPVFAEGIRLAAALRALRSDRMLGMIMGLAAGSDLARVEAARTIPYSMGLADPTWGHSLLLQLSHDPNPVVRAEAASSLVQALVHASPLVPSVQDRVRELLHADGLRVPAMILYAVRRVGEVDASAVAFLRSSIESISRSTPRLTKQIASGLIADLWI